MVFMLVWVGYDAAEEGFDEKKVRLRIRERHVQRRATSRVANTQVGTTLMEEDVNDAVPLEQGGDMERGVSFAILVNGIHETRKELCAGGMMMMMMIRL